MRERTKSAHANGEFIARQRELIVIRTSSLGLIGASKRGGCMDRRKYSFEIDEFRRANPRPLRP